MTSWSSSRTVPEQGAIQGWSKVNFMLWWNCCGILISEGCGLRIRVQFNAVCCVSCDGQSLFISWSVPAPKLPRDQDVEELLQSLQPKEGYLGVCWRAGWLSPQMCYILFTTYQPQSYMYIYIDAVLYPYQWPYMYCTILNISVTCKTKHTWIKSKKDVGKKRFRIQQALGS